MNFPNVSPYLANMVVMRKENDEGFTVSGGLPLKMFSEHQIGGSSMDKSVDGISKIGGLSVPIGLVLNQENNEKIRVKYSNNDNKIKEFTGGSPTTSGGQEDTSVYENAILGGSLTTPGGQEETGGSTQKNGIMNDIEMKNLLGVVCNSREKQNTRKRNK